MRAHRLAAVLSLALPTLLAAAAAARTESTATSWCGTHESNVHVQLAEHEKNLRRLARERPDLPLKRAKATAIGDVAVIEADASILQPANPFDLDFAGLRFVRRKTEVKPGRYGGPFRAEIGDRLALGDDDTVRVAFPDGFTFRFYGETYDAMFVNSDGNITFGQGDSASTERGLGRFLNGPPRLAPLFTDLDPTTATGNGGVYFGMAGSVAVVTWMEVPEFGSTRRATFQITMARSGRATFKYGDVGEDEAIVGVSPGGGRGLELLDYATELPGDRTPNAVAEAFRTQTSLDDASIARAFYETFEDRYHHLIVWLGFTQSLDGAFAFEANVQNHVEGIGLLDFDFSEGFGSDGGLESYVQMGTLSRYPDDPSQVFLGSNSTLAVLGQETGHRWLAFVGFVDDSGNVSSELLGRDFSHWSFFTDSDASVMEGNDIRDDGNGTFATVAATERFSALDQYIMGLRPPSSVPPFFFIRNGSGADPEDNPQVGVTLSGTRVNLTVNDIIDLHGPRRPSSTTAEDRFEMAFIVVTRPGEDPTAAVAKVDRIRRQWETFFRNGTDGLGSVRTRLVER